MLRTSISTSCVNSTDSFGSEQSRKLPVIELSLMKTSSKQEEDDKKPLSPQLRQGLKSVYNNIALAIIIITVSFLVFVGLPFYVVFDFRVHRGGLPSNLELPSDVDDDSVYFADYSATRLPTIASWASNIAAILPAFIMTSSSYRLAIIFQEQSEKAQSDTVGALL